MIKVKTVNLDTPSIDQKWCEDDFYRIFYNVLSAGIPGFERYVIKAVREVRDDPALDNEPHLRELADIFVQQEVAHTRAHMPVNKQLNLDNLVAAKYGEKISRFIARFSSKKTSLAGSAFLEFVGFGFFEDHIRKDVLDSAGFHGEMQKLWKWHLCEELEHSFIKLKVINHMDNSYWYKFWGMMEALVVAQLLITILIPELVWRDAKLTGKKFWPHLWRFLKGLGDTDWGVNKKSVGNYFAKDFDPELKDPWVQGQIDKWIEESGATEK
jgi:predicted metal-dependent hydrolase